MLYIISTPIGNLDDISKRAVDTLNKVDLIIAESPQDSLKLLNFLGVKGKKVFKFNDRNKKGALAGLIKILLEKDAGYITSAGTPGISDPGQDLVLQARENNIPVRIIPGPSALVSAIAASGLRAREFSFASFPPKKSGQLINFFKRYESQKTLLAFFESTHRILKTLEVLENNFPEVNVFVAKEMTKIFEKYFFGKAEKVLEEIKKDPKNIKGEFVVLVDFS